jgi:hypothetical protein
MHLSDLSAEAAITEAKSRHDVVDPHFFDFIDMKFLQRLQNAFQQGLLDPAIKEAARSGYESSMAAVFGGLVGRGKVATEHSNDVEEDLEDGFVNEVDSLLALQAKFSDTRLENLATQDSSDLEEDLEDSFMNEVDSLLALQAKFADTRLENLAAQDSSELRTKVEHSCTDDVHSLLGSQAKLSDTRLENPAMQDSNELEEQMEDSSMKEFDPLVGLEAKLSVTILHSLAPSEYLPLADSSGSTVDSAGSAREHLETNSPASISEAPTVECANVVRQDSNNRDRMHNKLFFDFADFLQSLQNTQREGLTELAIWKEASQSGYENSMVSVFGNSDERYYGNREYGSAISCAA